LGGYLLLLGGFGGHFEVGFLIWNLGAGLVIGFCRNG